VTRENNDACAESVGWAKARAKRTSLTKQAAQRRAHHNTREHRRALVGTALCIRAWMDCACGPRLCPPCESTNPAKQRKSCKNLR
jgi:hypothetical protein